MNDEAPSTSLREFLQSFPIGVEARIREGVVGIKSPRGLAGSRWGIQPTRARFYCPGERCAGEREFDPVGELLNLGTLVDECRPIGQSILGLQMR